MNRLNIKEQPPCRLWCASALAYDQRDVWQLCERQACVRHDGWSVASLEQVSDQDESVKVVLRLELDGTAATKGP